MTIREQAKAVVEALRDWARENKGTVSVASDQVHALELIRVKPGGVRVVLLFEGENPRGEWTELGKVDRGFKVVLSAGRGFRVGEGENLTEGSAGGRPVFDLAEEARELVRALRFETSGDAEDAVPRYAGIGAFRVEGFILDAYEVRFEFGSQIPRQE